MLFRIAGSSNTEASFLHMRFILLLLSYDAVTAPLICPLMRYLPMKI